MDKQELTTTVQAMMQAGKGLLAMDESTRPVTNALPNWGYRKRRRPAGLGGN